MQATTSSNVTKFAIKQDRFESFGKSNTLTYVLFRAVSAK
jgi:hypothetical protein